MEFEVLKAGLLEAGYKPYPVMGRGVIFCAQKVWGRGEEATNPSPPGCLENDNKIFIDVSVSEFSIGMGREDYRSVTFSITGGFRKNTPIKIEIYALKWEEALPQVKQIERELVAAWLGVCHAAGRFEAEAELP